MAGHCDLQRTSRWGAGWRLGSSRLRLCPIALNKGSKESQELAEADTIVFGKTETTERYLLLYWGEKPKQTVLSRKSEVRKWSQTLDWLEPYQLPALSLLLMLDILPGLGCSVTQRPGKKLRALRSGIYN